MFHKWKSFIDRDADSLVIFIPRVFRESGNGNLSFPWGSGKLKPIPRVSGRGSGKFRGVFHLRFEDNLKFLSIEKNFFTIFFRNQKNNMIFMIRSDKIVGN